MRTELVTSLKRQATALLLDIERDKDPILIAQHGLPARICWMSRRMSSWSIAWQSSKESRAGALIKDPPGPPKFCPGPRGLAARLDSGARRQRRDMRRGAFAQRGEVVATFERRGDPTVGVAVGEFT
jgi:hypothetical protein